MTASWKLAGLALAVFLGFVSQTNGFSRRALAEPHLVGTLYTKVEEVPYQISLETFWIHMCGGVIVSDKHVLTSAQCVAVQPFSEILWSMQVRAGRTIQIPLYNPYDGVFHRIESIKVHPKLERRDYDVAVITVSNKFEFGPRIQPISIPTEGPDFIDYNQKVKLSGWGLTQLLGGWLPQFHLQSVEIPLMPWQACKDENWALQKITSRIFCGLGEGMKDSYSVVRGGPVVQKGKLIGLITWIHHVFGELPPGFANLLDPEMRSFIKEETGV